MKICKECGLDLSDSATICPGCGTKIEDGNKREEYAGSVVKCPACGQPLSSFDGVCPACGHEINVEKISRSFKDFADGLAAFDGCPSNTKSVFAAKWSAWSPTYKAIWIILNICLLLIPMAIVFLIPLIKGKDSFYLTDSDEKMAAYIENYAFSNDRATTIEALMFIDTKTTRLVHTTSNANALFWASVWKDKAEHIFDKSELIVPNDPTASEAFNNIKRDFRAVRSNTRRRAVFKFIFAAIVSGLLISLLALYVAPLVENNAQARSEQYESQYVWPDYGLWRDLPEPASSYGVIKKDKSDYVAIDVYKVSQESFDIYAQKCRAMGYDQDYSISSERFSAKNWLGRQVIASYSASEKIMNVSLEKKGWF